MRTVKSWWKMKDTITTTFVILDTLYTVGYLFKVWDRKVRICAVSLMMTSSNGNIFRVTGPLCGEFTGPRWIPHTKRPVTRSFDVYFDLHPNKRLGKQSWGWWFETLSWSLWRHRNGVQKFQVLWNEWLISSQTLLSMWLLIHVRITVNPC